MQKLRALGYQGFSDAAEDIQTRLFLESADQTFKELQGAIARQEPVGVETVLSTKKYCPLVEAVTCKKGFVGLIYVALSSPLIARTRVAARVQRGGHGIPGEKIDHRWHRSLEILPWFAKNATAFWVMDNSDSHPENPPSLLASGKFGSLEYLNDEAFPEMKIALANLPVQTNS